MDVTFRGKQLEAAVVATAKNFFGRCDRFDRVFPIGALVVLGIGTEGIL